MKKFLIIFFLAYCLFAQGTQWSSYPRVTSLLGTDVLLMSRSLSMKGFVFSDMKTSLRSLYLDTAYVRIYSNQHILGRKTFSDSVSFYGNTIFNKELSFTNVGTFVLPTTLGNGEGSLSYNTTRDKPLFRNVGGDLDTIITSLANADIKGKKTFRQASIVDVKGAFKLTGRDTAITDFVYAKVVGGVRHLYWRRDNSTAVSLDIADTSSAYTWTGLHQWAQDSLKINGLWYDFPLTRIANSVLYDSLGNGIMKWKVYPTGADSAIFATKYFVGQTYEPKFTTLGISKGGTNATSFVTDKLIKFNGTKFISTTFDTTYLHTNNANRVKLDSIIVAASRINAIPASYTSGTVTSVAMTVPTGLTVSGSPITTSGTLAVTLTSGYVIPTTTEQTNWGTAYTNRITSLTTTGSSGASTLISNTLNVPQYTLAGLGGTTLAAVVAATNTFTATNTFNTSSSATDIIVGNGAQPGKLALRHWNAGADTEYDIILTPEQGVGSGDVTITAPHLTGTMLLTTSSAGSFPTLNQNTSGSSGSCTGNAATVTNGVYTNATNTLIGTNEFQGDLKFTDDFVNVWESATIATYAMDASGKTAITVNGGGDLYTINGGADGKEIIIMNINASTQAITEDGNMVNIPADAISLNQYGIIKFKYYTSASKWICTGVANN